MLQPSLIHPCHQRLRRRTKGRSSHLWRWRTSRSAIVEPLVSPIRPVATQKLDTDYTSRPLISSELGAFGIRRWSPSSLPSIAQAMSRPGLSGCNAQSNEHRWAPIAGDATQQATCAGAHSLNRERCPTSIGLSSLHRSRQVSSSKALFR